MKASRYHHLEGLKPREREFVLAFVHGGINATEAARKAGYPLKSAKVRAWELVRKPTVQKAIAIETEALARDHAPMAFGVLIKLAKTAKAEVKLKAAVEILNRTGFSPSRTLEVTHRHELSDLNPDQLRARLAILWGDLSVSDRTQLAGLGVNPVVDAEFTVTEVSPIGGASVPTDAGGATGLALCGPGAPGAIPSAPGSSSGRVLDGDAASSPLAASPLFPNSALVPSQVPDAAGVVTIESRDDLETVDGEHSVGNVTATRDARGPSTDDEDEAYPFEDWEAFR